MTRIILIVLLASLLSCKKESTTDAVPVFPVPAGTPRENPPLETPVPQPDTPEAPAAQPQAPPAPTPPATDHVTTKNGRFRNVSVRKAAEGEYTIAGEARVFEATYSYVVEDGHDELASGFGTTSAGAPEWGRFSFPLKVTKKRPNSTLHLVLFESSPKDGSRTHEYAVRLP